MVGSYSASLRDADLQLRVTDMVGRDGGVSELFNFLDVIVVEDVHGASKVGTRACVTHASDVLFLSSACPGLIGEQHVPPRPPQ